ncbi:MAG: hypothetical protein ACOZAG_01780 [Patescibacteria group bacterium]
MDLTKFKESKEFFWTKHAIAKMVFYGLAPGRVKKIFRGPDRTQEGVVPGTVAMMQRVGKGKRQTEIWVMWQKGNGSQKKIIAAWRYPGSSPVKEIPIPPEILEELKK